MNAGELEAPDKFGVPYRYIIIDLKSFYASVECVERGMDPMTTNLVVSETEI